MKRIFSIALMAGCLATCVRAISDWSFWHWRPHAQRLMRPPKIKYVCTDHTQTPLPRSDRRFIKGEA